MTWNEAKRNAIIQVFLKKRNVTFFFVFPPYWNLKRNFSKKSGTQLLEDCTFELFFTHMRLKWISKLTFEAQWRIWRISNIFMNQILFYQLVCQLSYPSISWAICKQMFSRPTRSHLCYVFIWEMCMFLSLCFLISQWESHWENFFSHFSPWEKVFLILAPLIWSNIHFS